MEEREKELIGLAQQGIDEEIASDAMVELRTKYDPTYFWCDDCDYAVVKESECCVNRKDEELADEDLNWDYPGIGSEHFNLVLTDPFKKLDVLNDHLIILSDAEPVGDYFKVRVGSRETFIHDQFLYKYSEFLHFTL